MSISSISSQRFKFWTFEQSVHLHIAVHERPFLKQEQFAESHLTSSSTALGAEAIITPFSRSATRSPPTSVYSSPLSLGENESVEGEAVWVGSGRVELKEHRRREDRGAFVVGMWVGYPPPQLTKGYGGFRKLLSGVRDEVPAENEFGALESCQKATGGSRNGAESTFFQQTHICCNVTIPVCKKCNEITTRSTHVVWMAVLVDSQYFLDRV